MARNLPVAFAAIIAGGVLADAAIKGASIGDVIKGQATSSGSSGSSPAADSGSGSGNAYSMLAAASAAAKAGVPYSSNVNASGLLAGFRSDCSGFVSWVLSKGGVNVGDATTTTLPTAAGITAGPGSQVTLWNRPLPGQAGHVIINILGKWFESGGQLAGGITGLTDAQAASELGVSNVGDLGDGQTPNGFDPLHPEGL